MSSLWREVRWGPRVSELTEFSPVFPAMESSSPKTRVYGEWRFRERDEQGRENYCEGL